MASFISGFSYVLYVLPPMGDGTMFPSEHPYVVPCAYDSYSKRFADSSVPECVRLFTQSWEFEVVDLQQKLLQFFVAVGLLSVVNIVFIQRRVSSAEAMLLAGLEVSAVSCSRRMGESDNGYSAFEG